MNLKGMRDFNSQEIKNRTFITNTLSEIFQKYGYDALETPAIERNKWLIKPTVNSEVNKLMFSVFNTGDLAKITNESTTNSLNTICSVNNNSLRYDLTIPLVRYVGQNYNDLAFPYKRHQIQPVWRGESPQKGRYREFYQCDIDVVGSKSLYYEAELLKICDESFSKLNLKVIIKLNNRKILYGITEFIGAVNNTLSVINIIDKLDKINKESISFELKEIGLTNTQIDLLFYLLSIDDLEKLKLIFKETPIGLEGIDEIETVLKALNTYSFSNKLIIDFKLARGLDYYTGCIYEVIIDNEILGQEHVSIKSSIAGGGRYDNLIKEISGYDLPSVGISFGIDRIYDLLIELKRFTHISYSKPAILFMALDNQSLTKIIEYSDYLRSLNFNVDALLEIKPLKKQLTYANKINVPFVGILGETELVAGKIQVKNMLSGETSLYDINQLTTLLST